MLDWDTRVIQRDSQSQVDAQVFLKWAQLLAHSFFFDPFFMAMMPDEKKRHGQMIWWMRSVLSFGLKCGKIITHEGSPEAVAILVEGQLIHSHFYQLGRYGLFHAPLQLGPRNFAKMLGLLNEWNVLHREFTQPHLTGILGVGPGSQNKGVGTKLMQSLLEEGEKRRLPLRFYLAEPAHLEVFEKWGFKVVQKREITRSASSLTFWVMQGSASP